MIQSVLSLFLFISCAKSANILGVFLIPSVSHQIVYQPIWRELSLRGHNVTVVTPDPLNDPSLTNLTEISVRFTYDIMKQNKLQEIVSKDENKFQSLVSVLRLLDIIAEAELNSTQFKKLIEDDLKFDLILIECFHPVMYGLAGYYKAPIIGVSSMGVFTPIYDAVGNPNHPIFYPDVLLNYHQKELSIWQKTESLAFNLWSRYYYHRVHTPRAHEMAKKYFGNDLPYIGDLEKNVSMLFLNVNPLMYPPRPNVPTIVEMGQMHIKPPKPLPKDLQTILDGATEGVIYFSLGSNVKSVHISESVRDVIIGAFSEVSYTVIWKWESDHLPGKPENVVIRKWLPQQDILAHPNIKVFITQGGLQSTEEAISRNVPLIGMPFMGDQPMNVQKIIDLGIGLGVDPTTVTKDELKEKIIEVAENKIYKKRVKDVRDLLYDKPMTGLEKAVWWSEYVIRHRGTRHLRSPTADVSWIEYLLLDVIVVVSVIVGAILFLSVKLAQISFEYRKEKLKCD